MTNLGVHIKTCAMKIWNHCECEQQCKLHNPDSFKVIIAGGRDFEDYELLVSKMNHLLRNRGVNVEIVSGGARGDDRLGERYARDRGLKLKKFPADWETHGKSAGMIRNKEMAEYADVLVAFWDGQSKGTKNMIDSMDKLGKPYRVISYGD